jgi:hypothetical protein
MKSHSVAALALVCLSMVALGSALSFDSAPNQIKCFRENLARHQVVSGDVSTMSSPFMQLKFWVRTKDSVSFRITLSPPVLGP